MTPLTEAGKGKRKLIGDLLLCVLIQLAELTGRGGRQDGKVAAAVAQHGLLALAAQHVPQELAQLRVDRLAGLAVEKHRDHARERIGMIHDAVAGRLDVRLACPLREWDGPHLWVLIEHSRVADAVGIIGHRIEHPLPAVGSASLRALEVGELPQRWPPELAAVEHALLEESGEAARDRQAVKMDRPIPPCPGEPEITPRARRNPGAAVRHREERAELRQGQSLDRVVLVHENDERVITVTDVEAAGDHIDAGRRMAEHFLDRRDLRRPDLPPHQGEVAAPRIKRAYGRRRAHQMILEADTGLVLLEAALPGAHQGADEVALAIVGAVSPDADGAGNGLIRVIRGRQSDARAAWRSGAGEGESHHDSERTNGPHCRRSSCLRTPAALSGRYAPSLTTMRCPSRLSTKRRNSFTRGSMAVPGRRSSTTATVRSSG